jgi:hypothetical protein
VDQLTAAQRQLDITAAKRVAAEADAVGARRAEADLRGDLAASRLELSAERQRSAEALATLEAAIKARESHAIQARAELDDAGRQHRAELDELHRRHHEELAAIRIAHAQEIEAERDRNGILGLALADALRTALIANPGRQEEITS